MTKTNKQKNQTFLGILKVQTDGKIKVKKAQRLTNINQYKTKWTNIDSRNFGRFLNRAEFLIK